MVTTQGAALVGSSGCGVDVSNRIRKVRESKGFSVQDACDKADVSRAQYYRINEAKKDHKRGPKDI
jgi:ACT domain-containing protein